MSRILHPLELVDKFLLACSVGLAISAHFLRFFHLAPENFNTGWRLAREGFSYSGHFLGTAPAGKLSFESCVLFVGYLSNPLYWLGVGILLAAYLVRSRRAGYISACAGIAAVTCTAVFRLNGMFAALRLSTGFYVWVAALITMTAAGFYRARSDSIGVAKPKSCD